MGYLSFRKPTSNWSLLVFNPMLPHALAGLSGGSQAKAREKPLFFSRVQALPGLLRSSYRHKPVASLSSSRALHITNLCYCQWLNTGSASFSIYLPSAPKCTFKNSY